MFIRKSEKLIIVVAISIILCTMFVGAAQAAELGNDGIEFVPQTTIPNSEFRAGATISIKPDTLGKYIKAVYQYGVGIVSVFAVVMIMWGGFKYVFAAGNKDRLQAAKTTIISAFMGLILALGSYILLYTINPNLVNFADLNIVKPEINISCPAVGDGGYVRTCDGFNALSAADIDNFNEGKTPIKSVAEICVDFATQINCGLPQGLCFWGDDQVEKEFTATDAECRSIIGKDCSGSGKVPSCLFDYGRDANIQLYCAGGWLDWNECSLGTIGSGCANNDQCINTCVDGECT
jgi:hypothetical protein